MSITPTDLSQRQWHYLFTVLDFLDRRQPVTIVACSQAAHVARTTVWNWHQNAHFLRALDRVQRGLVRPRNAMVEYAIQRDAMAGNTKAQEQWVKLRELDIAQAMGAGAPGGTGVGVAGASARASITFINLPQPPTPADRERLVPAPGSTQISRNGVLIETKPVAEPPGGVR